MWRELRDRLAEQDTWTDTDHSILDRLVANHRDADDYRKQLREAGSIVGTDRGPQPHPLVKMIRDAERDIHRDEEALVLAPKARIQRGVAHVIKPQEVGIDDLLADRS